MTAPPSPGALALPAADEVHVWTCFVSALAGQRLSLGGLLTREETEKTGRFVRADDATRHVVAHGVLRRLLAGYLGVEPAAVALTAGPFGKPALAGAAGSTGLAFNLAHSGDVVAYAVARAPAVGIDVEADRPEIDVTALAATCFSPVERARLAAMAEEERRDAFFRGWTRKEAYLKARGVGLGYPLDQFTVTLDRADRPALEWVADDASAPRRWAMADFSPAPGYAGAVVIEGRIAHLVRRAWPA